MIDYPGLTSWLASGERGISSNTIVTCLTGINALGGHWHSHPLDPDDMTRCRKLLERVPLLSKRIGNWRARMTAVLRIIMPGYGMPTSELAEWVASWVEGNPPRNVWLGATVCNQEEADRDLPKLERVPAAVHFVSVEPMLGSVDLGLMRYHDSDSTDENGRIIANTRRRWLRWVICGGESGKNARPMHQDWARSLRDQCSAAGVPFFFKQYGEFAPIGNTRDDGVLTDFVGMSRIGLKAAGRLLDGREHNEFPGVSA